MFVVFHRKNEIILWRRDLRRSFLNNLDKIELDVTTDRAYINPRRCHMWCYIGQFMAHFDIQLSSHSFLAQQILYTSLQKVGHRGLIRIPTGKSAQLYSFVQCNDIDIRLKRVSIAGMWSDIYLFQLIVCSLETVDMVKFRS